MDGAKLQLPETIYIYIDTHIPDGANSKEQAPTTVYYFLVPIIPSKAKFYIRGKSPHGYKKNYHKHR